MEWAHSASCQEKKNSTSKSYTHIALQADIKARPTYQNGGIEKRRRVTWGALLLETMTIPSCIVDSKDRIQA